jgi:UDP-GlcNAc:undecaprenyl-phosphate GlcNAc-1-phosphate transferase
MLCVLGAACALCLALTPLARVLAVRYGLVDRPDGRRKIHARPIPVSGGLAVLAATAATLGGAALVPGGLQEHLADQGHWLLGLLLGAVTICAVGVADDCGRLRARHKLLGQCLAVFVVMACGVLVQRVHLFGWWLDLGSLAVPFTTFLLLGAINSLNLLDGMDGLLGTVGVIVSLALAGMAALAGQWPAAAVAFALAGSLLGFLRYNLPPASVFLGDCGSMVVGLVLGTLAIKASLKAPATIALVMPVALLILPILDTTAAILRRKLTGRSIYSTDRGHLHHCLLRRGLSVWRVLLVVSFFSTLAGVGVLASKAFNNEWIALLTGLSVVGVLVVTGLFGYAEMALVKERLLALLLAGKGKGLPRQIEVRLQGSADWRELWRILTAVAGQLGLHQLRLDVNAPSLHEGYYACWDHPAEVKETRGLWRAEIPLTAGGLAVGRVELAGRPDAEPVWQKIAAVARVVEEFENATAALQCGWSVPAPADDHARPAAAEAPARAAPDPDSPTPRGADLPLLPVPVPQAE